jgi:hypothetical protein
LRQVRRLSVGGPRDRLALDPLDGLAAGAADWRLRASEQDGLSVEAGGEGRAPADALGLGQGDDAPVPLRVRLLAPGAPAGLAEGEAAARLLAAAEGGGVSGGMANLRPVPATPGNRLAETHGFYVQALSVAEEGEVAEIAETLRALSPIVDDWGAKAEPLIAITAGQLWRLRRGYKDLAEHGLTRGKGRQPAPILARLEALERQLLANLAALALTPKAAADLGLTIARVKEIEAGRGVDLERLSPQERLHLSELLDKARGIT